MDARFMQMHNFVLTREIIINSSFPVDRMRELNFHRETALWLLLHNDVSYINFRKMALWWQNNTAYTNNLQSDDRLSYHAV